MLFQSDAELTREHNEAIGDAMSATSLAALDRVDCLAASSDAVGDLEASRAEALEALQHTVALQDRAQRDLQAARLDKDQAQIENRNRLQETQQSLVARREALAEKKRQQQALREAMEESTRSLQSQLDEAEPRASRLEAQNLATRAERILPVDLEVSEVQAAQQLRLTEIAHQAQVASEHAATRNSLLAQLADIARAAEQLRQEEEARRRRAAEEQERVIQERIEKEAAALAEATKIEETRRKAVEEEATKKKLHRVTFADDSDKLSASTALQQDGSVSASSPPSLHDSSPTAASLSSTLAALSQPTLSAASPPSRPTSPLPKADSLLDSASAGATPNDSDGEDNDNGDEDEGDEGNEEEAEFSPRDHQSAPVQADLYSESSELLVGQPGVTTSFEYTLLEDGVDLLLREGDEIVEEENVTGQQQQRPTHQRTGSRRFVRRVAAPSNVPAPTAPVGPSTERVRVTRFEPCFFAAVPAGAVAAAAKNAPGSLWQGDHPDIVAASMSSPSPSSSRPLSRPATASTCTTVAATTATVAPMPRPTLLSESKLVDAPIAAPEPQVRRIRLLPSSVGGGGESGATSASLPLKPYFVVEQALSLADRARISASSTVVEKRRRKDQRQHAQSQQQAPQRSRPPSRSSSRAGARSSGGSSRGDNQAATAATTVAQNLSAIQHNTQAAARRPVSSPESLVASAAAIAATQATAQESMAAAAAAAAADAAGATFGGSMSDHASLPKPPHEPESRDPSHIARFGDSQAKRARLTRRLIVWRERRENGVGAEEPEPVLSASCSSSSSSSAEDEAQTGEEHAKHAEDATDSSGTDEETKAAAEADKALLNPSWKQAFSASATMMHRASLKAHRGGGGRGGRGEADHNDEGDSLVAQEEQEAEGEVRVVGGFVQRRGSLPSSGAGSVRAMLDAVAAATAATLKAKTKELAKEQARIKRAQKHAAAEAARKEEKAAAARRKFEAESKQVEQPSQDDRDEAKPDAQSQQQPEEVSKSSHTSDENEDELHSPVQTNPEAEAMDDHNATTHSQSHHTSSGVKNNKTMKKSPRHALDAEELTAAAPPVDRSSLPKRVRHAAVAQHASEDESATTPPTGNSKVMRKKPDAALALPDRSLSSRVSNATAEPVSTAASHKARDIRDKTATLVATPPVVSTATHALHSYRKPSIDASSSSSILARSESPAPSSPAPATHASSVHAQHKINHSGSARSGSFSRETTAATPVVTALTHVSPTAVAHKKKHHGQGSGGSGGSGGARLSTGSHTSTLDSENENQEKDSKHDENEEALGSDNADDEEQGEEEELAPLVYTTEEEEEGEDGLIKTEPAESVEPAATASSTPTALVVASNAAASTASSSPLLTHAGTLDSPAIEASAPKRKSILRSSKPDLQSTTLVQKSRVAEPANARKSKRSNRSSAAAEDNSRSVSNMSSLVDDLAASAPDAPVAVVVAAADGAALKSGPRAVEFAASAFASSGARSARPLLQACPLAAPLAVAAAVAAALATSTSSIPPRPTCISDPTIALMDLSAWATSVPAAEEGEFGGVGVTENSSSNSAGAVVIPDVPTSFKARLPLHEAPSGGSKATKSEQQSVRGPTQKRKGPQARTGAVAVTGRETTPLSRVEVYASALRSEAKQSSRTRPPRVPSTHLPAATTTATTRLQPRPASSKQPLPPSALSTAPPVAHSSPASGMPSSKSRDIQRSYSHLLASAGSPPHSVEPTAPGPSPSSLILFDEGFFTRTHTAAVAEVARESIIATSRAQQFSALTTSSDPSSTPVAAATTVTAPSRPRSHARSRAASRGDSYEEADDEGVEEKQQQPPQQQHHWDSSAHYPLQRRKHSNSPPSRPSKQQQHHQHPPLSSAGVVATMQVAVHSRTSVASLSGSNEGLPSSSEAPPPPPPSSHSHAPISHLSERSHGGSRAGVSGGVKSAGTADDVAHAATRVREVDVHMPLEFLHAAMSPTATGSQSSRRASWAPIDRLLEGGAGGGGSHTARIYQAATHSYSSSSSRPNSAWQTPRSVP